MKGSFAPLTHLRFCLFFNNFNENSRVCGFFLINCIDLVRDSIIYILHFQNNLKSPGSFDYNKARESVIYQKMTIKPFIITHFMTG